MSDGAMVMALVARLCPVIWLLVCFVSFLDDSVSKGDALIASTICVLAIVVNEKRS